MHTVPRMPYRLLLSTVLALLYSVPVAADFSGLAIVNEDASLAIRNRDVVLRGVFIPEQNNRCQPQVRPPRCGAPAALALEFRIDGFVHCENDSRRADGKVVATCYSGRDAFDPGIDLGAYLIKRGWALANSDAPPEYTAYERVARHQGLGIWGSPGSLAD